MKLIEAVIRKNSGRRTYAYGRLLQDYNEWNAELEDVSEQITNTSSGIVKRSVPRRIVYSLISIFSKKRSNEYHKGIPELKRGMRRIDSIIKDYEVSKPSCDELLKRLYRDYESRTNLNLREDWEYNYLSERLEIRKSTLSEPVLMRSIISGELDWETGKYKIAKFKERSKAMEQEHERAIPHLEHILQQDAELKRKIFDLETARSQLECSLRAARLNYIFNIMQTGGM